MTSLLEIRQRIKSVQNVGQITKAMEMVAAAQMKKAQSRAQNARIYLSEWQRILTHLSEPIKSEYPQLFESNHANKTIILVVASDRGLCGNYNQLLMKTASKLVEKYRKEDVELILVGKKAVNAFGHHGWEVKERIAPWGGKLGPGKIHEVGNALIQAFSAGRFKELIVVYTSAKNPLVRELMTETILPIRLPETPKTPPNYIIEPEFGVIREELIQGYIFARLQTVFNEAFAAELTARTFAMKKATKNAEEMFVELTLQRNKIRQAGITREMIEITAGAEGV